MCRLAPWACLPLILAMAGSCWAQGSTASLTVSATDQSGAAALGVAVTVLNTNTGLLREGKTNDEGILTFPFLPPGTYIIRASKDGFNQVEIKNEILHINDAVELPIKLKIGPVTETVTVTAAGSMIDTQDATISTTVDRRFAENLPLNGRSFQTLILLTPGTVITGSSFSVNGQRDTANNFTVDGVSANLGGYIGLDPTGNQNLNGASPSLTVAGTTQGMVTVDALEEFKIQTSTYAPEFGRQPGGQISLLTRSGTNAFHGTAFDYLRNTVLDASNWFNGFVNDPSLPKGQDRQNDFGGTFGGPVFKDKTFFFFSYEGLRLQIPTTNEFIVPDSSLRQAPAVAPVYLPLMNYFPIPNGPDFGDGSALYTLDKSLPTNMNAYMIKVDHAIGKRLHLFGRYSDTPSNLKDVSFNDATTIDSQVARSRSLTLGADLAISPRWSDELRLNYAVNTSREFFIPQASGGGVLFDTSILFPKPLVNGIDQATWLFFLPDTGFFDQMVFGPQAKNAQRQINIVDNVSHPAGPHQLKWGIDYRRLFPIIGSSPASVVYEVFTNSDLMSGNLSNTLIAGHVTGHPIYINFSAYAQDTWRISGRLTLTYGLRWELNPTPTDRDGFVKDIPNLVGISNPATATLASAGSPIFKTTYNNFAPRIGIAYQLRQARGYETVVRGGVGMFYDLNSQTLAEGFQAAAFSNRAQISGLPFPVADNVLTIPSVPASVQPPFFKVIAVDPNLQLPFTVQWNASVEQGLGQNQSLSASYVASAGYRLLRMDTLENVSPVATIVDAVRNASSSNYQSLQLQFDRRLSHGVQALASYTYSHSIDDASNSFTNRDTFVPGTLPNPSVDRGNSNFDLRHALRAALTYDIPTPKAGFLSKAVLSGWSVDSIAIAQTGLPEDLIGGFANLGSADVRPDVVPGQPLYVQGVQQCNDVTTTGNTIPCPGNRGLNPAAFQLVPADSNGNALRQGTLGRNVLRGFGAVQMDFGIHRRFNLTERANLQFRAEFFNAFNHPNFGFVNPQVGSPTFGQALFTLNNSLFGESSLYQIGGPRSIQLALKLSF